MLKEGDVTSQFADKVGMSLFIGWTVIIVIVGLLHNYINYKLILNSALIEARTLANQEELSRLWVAEQGGVYIPERSASASGRFDAVPAGPQAGTINNGRLHLVGHVEMTRQLYRKLETEFGYRARLIRLNSNHKDRVPDDWERDALNQLVRGETSATEITSVDGLTVLRLVRATRGTAACSGCHGDEYQDGEIFGAFSLSMPLDSYYATLVDYRSSILFGYFVIWSVGLLLTYLAVHLFKRQIAKVKKQESQLQIAETSLHYISYFDPGTNLPNRATFDDRMLVAMAHAERLDEMIAIAVINIENFTKIRNLFSRGISDLLIKKVAEKVSREIRPDDTIARMGNDRLLLLLPGLVSRENVARIINNINEGFATPIELEGSEVYVKISFGVSVFPDDTQDAKLLVTYAETAAARVSQQNLSNLQMYSEALNEAAHAHLQLETGLRQGLNRNEFCVYYQPQIDAPSGAIIGAEALLRWNHPSRGLIPPDQFVPMAENNGAIIPIGEWVLHDACAQAVRWQQDYKMPFRIGVNVSARQFQDVALVDVIDRVLDHTGINPENLEIEVTEGTIMEDTDKAIETLLDLKVRGVKVAIDDFGTGYSSLGQLKILPFDRLKIDRSFIVDIEGNKESQVIVEMIINLAAKLDIEIIAEGIETEAQKKFLISRGCYPMQGYFFGKPMPAADFTRFLESLKK